MPEFAGRIVQQGVIKKIEISLHTMSGFCNINIREKVKHLIISKEILTHSFKKYVNHAFD